MNRSDERRSILVGYDGSPAAEQALAWAAEEARLRALPVTVCHAWAWPYPFHPVERELVDRIETVGATVVDTGARRIQELAGEIEVRTHLARGTAAGVVLDAARDADLVVLGSRGHGGFEELHVGSTAAQVPAHSATPVIVVRPTLPPVRTDGVRIAVGVDGSPAGDAALGFAFAEAGLRGGAVTAICAWWDPSALPGPNRLPFTDVGAMKRDAAARFEDAVAPWAARHPTVPVTTEFATERPERALVDLARDAVLLVVGDRGVGSAPAVRLGPVAHTALSAAPCPVAVTPAAPG